MPFFYQVHTSLNLQLPTLALYIFLLGCIDRDKSISPYSNEFKPAIKSGTILDENLYEASGLVASRTNIGMFWTINDSGNDARLFLIDAKGNTVHYYWIDNAVNIDWEDLTIYTDDKGKSKIYIGDVGDNDALRKNINIIIFDEPVFDDPSDTIITDYKNHHFRYPDGAKDAETIMADPITSGLYIISKREQNVRLYEVPVSLNESDTMDLTYKTSLPFFNVTSGDISSDGKEVLLKTYDAIYYWKRLNNESLQKTMTMAYDSIAYNPEPQGESIAWSSDNSKGFYTLSEKSWARNQVLYFFERNNK